ncbi:hypothetical protein DFH09DRAFT_1251570 [Mycena vulgaris]|nr:hypothetical protein DFH09DRAFT_1251570 [Mycena vulgaris]
MTAYDFYATLEKLTDNTGIKPPNRYHAFLRMNREWSHLMRLKRAGRGHDPAGVEGTKPGVNLPEDWQAAAPEDRFLYIIFLALNVCFRLKRRLVSSELKDPPLDPEYLWTVTDQDEMSTCSGLAVLDHANSKFSRGYSATGVGMGVCARHEFIQPNGVGDLQKGEWYLLRHINPHLLKIVSYDIVCQWWKNLMKWLKLLPPLVRLHAALAALHLMHFVIPKMHIHSHTLACQLLFSLNLVPGSAQTDGEGIERPWANIGGVAMSTREMGPGSREDTLNTHWSHWNWQKLLGLAERLRTRTDRAKTEYAAQLESFTQFSMQQSDRVPAWGAMVEAFEKNLKQKNPYQRAVQSITEAQVLLRFAQDEALQTEAGVPSLHTVSPSSFVSAGLDVEDQQRRVRVQIALKKAGTTAQQIDVALDDKVVETMPLFLPSALSEAQRGGPLMTHLATIEESLRDAQCSTALERLRDQLHVKSRFLTYKELHARHQGPNTRTRGLVEQNESKIRLHSEKYQMAWEAMRRLAGDDPGLVG